eukprot:63530-Lingulodinium_polyedra.AAC.1
MPSTYLRRRTAGHNAATQSIGQLSTARRSAREHAARQRGRDGADGLGVGARDAHPAPEKT